ncbi:hypothetical protein DV737_g3654, partial [Chaetothyriales sp. CBS 132003]
MAGDRGVARASTLPLWLLLLATLLPVCRTAPSSDTRWVEYTGNDGTVWLKDDRRPSLYTQTFGDCQGNSLINVTRFDAAYYHDNMTVQFHLGGTSALTNESLMLYIGVYAYGESRFNLTFNPCSANINSLCPLNSSIPIEANGIIPVSQSDIANIPSIALSIPDFEGQAILRIFANSTESQISCFSAVITNGASFSHPVAIGSVLGLFALVALISSVAVTIYGHSVTDTRKHYAHSLSVMVVFAVYQHIFFTGVLSMNWPSVLVAFWSNYAWSAGMIFTTGMQDSINNFIGTNRGNISTIGSVQSGQNVQDLGGGYQISQIYRRASEILFMPYEGVGTTLRPRALEHALRRRDLVNSTSGFSWYGGLVRPGLPLPGNYSGFAGTLAEVDIPASNAFLTGLIWFLVLTVFIATLIVSLKWLIEALSHFNIIKSDRLAFFRRHWIRFTAAAVLRTCFLAFFMMMVLALFQFTLGGSTGVLAIAGLVFSLFFLGMFGLAVYALYSRLRHEKFVKPGDQLKVKRSDTSPLTPKSTSTEEAEEKQAAEQLESEVVTLSWWQMYFTDVDSEKPHPHDDVHYTTKFGWLASRFRRSKWWFFAFWLVYESVRACFYGAAAGHALTQVFGLLAWEILAFIAIILLKPFESNRLNLLIVYFLGFSKVATVALSSAFDEKFGLNRILTTVIGIVIIVIQGILTICLMLAVASRSASCTNKERKKEAAQSPFSDSNPEQITSGLTKEDVQALFSGAPHFMLEKGRRGLYFPQAFFPWDNEGLPPSELKAPNLTQSRMQPAFDMGVYERPNMIGLTAVEVGTMALHTYLERPVRDGLNEATVHDHGRNVDLPEILNITSEAELGDYLFSGLLYPPSKIIDGLGNRCDLKVQIEALVKVLTTPGVWVNLSLPRERWLFLERLYTASAEDQSRSDQNGISPSQQRHWNLVQLLLSIELAIRLDAALRLGIASHEIHITPREIHHFNKLRNLKVDWDLVVARRFSSLTYAKTIPSSSTKHEGASQQVQSPSQRPHHDGHGFLDKCKCSHSSDEVEPSYNIGIFPREVKSMAEGLIVFGTHLRWPTIKAVEASLKQKLAVTLQQQEEMLALGIEPPHCEYIPTDDNDTAVVELRPASETTIGGPVSHGWLRGFIIPGYSTPGLLMCTLLENDAKGKPIATLGNKAWTRSGFVWRKRSWWSKANIVSWVMAPIEGTTEVVGWVALPETVTPVDSKTGEKFGDGWLLVRATEPKKLREGHRIYDGDALAKESSPLGVGHGKVLSNEFGMATDNVFDKLPKVNVQNVELILEATQQLDRSGQSGEAGKMIYIAAVSAHVSFSADKPSKSISIPLAYEVRFVAGHPCRPPHGHVKAAESQQEQPVERRQYEHLPGHPLHNSFKYRVKSLEEVLGLDEKDWLPNPCDKEAGAGPWIIDARGPHGSSNCSDSSLTTAMTTTSDTHRISTEM